MSVGAVPSPFDCWLIQRSLKTLSVRMKAHNNNAFEIAQILKSNPKISSILTSLVKLALLFRLPISYFIKNTIYKHFCGGETIDDSQQTINKLWKSSIGTILDYSAEGKKSEEDFNKVLKETLQVIKESENNKKIPFICCPP